MNYKILEGQTINLNGKNITVETIEEFEHDLTQITYYVINDGGKQYCQFDIAQQVNIVLSERQDSGSRFGLYFHKFERMNTREIGFVMGTRDYGYHKCGFFVQLPIRKYMYCLEFSFADKNEYESGVLPYRGEPGINVMTWGKNLVKKLKK